MSNPVAEAQRIYENILVLLNNGLFLGELAAGVSEARQFVGKLLNQMEQDSNGSEAKQQDGSGVGNAADTDRVAGSEVPAPERKGRKGRGKRA